MKEPLIPPEFHLSFGLLQWAVLAVAAFIVGFSKSGVPGIGMLAVALFALVIPPRESTGAILPVLITGDILAVAWYHNKANWKSLRRILPPAAIGVVVGWLTMGHLSDPAVGKLIGGIMIGLVALQMARDRGFLAGDHVPHHWAFAWTFGLAGGFVTMVTNAAGPIMIVYLLAMRLDKIAFVGTAAWYFLIINLYKVPFSTGLGLINPESLLLNLKLIPVVFVGAVCGILAVKRIPEKQFRWAVIVLAVSAGAWLVVK